MSRSSHLSLPSSTSALRNRARWVNLVPCLMAITVYATPYCYLNMHHKTTGLATARVHSTHRSFREDETMMMLRVNSQREFVSKCRTKAVAHCEVKRMGVDSF
ncbi:hypothetical protein DFH06DRAFT_1203098 [Mycena polygramma]|nr:hypothetical protein DFH06DRAFT_1245108 [Mycena polygramma]KAJ7653871.1 hypothetical protein DFH06DRAFT_1203098 [Mycena polygramma]